MQITQGAVLELGRKGDLADIPELFVLLLVLITVMISVVVLLLVYSAGV
jgi:hypothetical protein